MSKAKHWVVLAALVAAGMAAGIYAKGISDAKGWTKSTP